MSNPRTCPEAADVVATSKLGVCQYAHPPQPPLPPSTGRRPPAADHRPPSTGRRDPNAHDIVGRTTSHSSPPSSTQLRECAARPHQEPQGRRGRTWQAPRPTRHQAPLDQHHGNRPHGRQHLASRPAPGPRRGRLSGRSLIFAGPVTNASAGYLSGRPRLSALMPDPSPVA